MKTLVNVAVDPLIVDVVQALQGLTQQVRELPDACAVERLVHERLKPIERTYMEQCVRLKIEQVIEQDVREVRCHHCEAWTVVRERRAARWALTVRGRIDFARPVYRCERRDCQRERCLVDEQLGLEPKEHFTPLVQSKVAWAATSSASFERAVKDLSRLAELERRSKAAGDEAQGLPIGSGAIEGTCKNLLKGRMAGVGMRWDAEQGIEPMCALRVRMFNQWWEDLWPHSQNPDAKAA